METEGPAPTPLSLPLERGGGAQRRRGPARPLPPSVEHPAHKLRPLDFALPKGGGRLVSTHAALSPELGSILKARSGCKSGTTAPGVQGAGRGPRRFLWLLSCPRKKVTRLSGRDPTTPPAGCRKILRRGNPSNPIPATAQQPKEKASGLRGSKFPAGRNKVDPSPYPPPKGGGWLVGTLRPLPLPRGRLASENRGASARPSQPPLGKGRWRAAPERFYPPAAALRRTSTPKLRPLPIPAA